MFLALLHRRDNCQQVIVQQHHVGCLATHVGAINTHCNANIGFFQSHRIINAIAAHAHRMANCLQCLLREIKNTVNASRGEIEEHSCVIVH